MFHKKSRAYFIIFVIIAIIGILYLSLIKNIISIDWNNLRSINWNVIEAIVLSITFIGISIQAFYTKKLADAQFTPSIDVKMMSDWREGKDKLGVRFALFNYSNFTVFFCTKIILTVDGSKEKKEFPVEGGKELPIGPAINSQGFGRLTEAYYFLGDLPNEEDVLGNKIKATIFVSYTTVFNSRSSDWMKINEYRFDFDQKEWLINNWGVSDRSYLDSLF